MPTRVAAGSPEATAPAAETGRPPAADGDDAGRRQPCVRATVSTSVETTIAVLRFTRPPVPRVAGGEVSHNRLRAQKAARGRGRPATLLDGVPRGRVE